MGIYIDARCVLFNILQAHKEIDLSALGSFRRFIEGKVSNIYVDISYVSILSILEDYSTYITKEGDLLKQTSEFGEFGKREFLDRTINRSFSKEVRNTIHEASINAVALESNL